MTDTAKSTSRNLTKVFKKTSKTQTRMYVRTYIKLKHHEGKQLTWGDHNKTMQ